MMLTMKTKILLMTALFLIFFSPFTKALAAEFSIKPFLIEKEVLSNDVEEDVITLSNDSDYRKYVVFATVNEISLDEAGGVKEFITPLMTDRTIDPTSWVEINRGRIEIDPNSIAEVPLTLRINPTAKPGDYFVFLGFVPAPNRPAAEATAMAGDADGVILKISVTDKRQDSIKIENFLIDRFVINDDNREIKIRLSNLGDLTSIPKGEIIFYNSRGEEINSLKVNEESLAIEPGQILDLVATVPLDNKLGRFKANLTLQYGVNQSGVLYDTTFFYMMPLNLLLVLFGGILVLTLLIIWLLRRTFAHDDYYPNDVEEVTMYIRDGHEANPKDHDIDLKNKKN